MYRKSYWIKKDSDIKTIGVSMVLNCASNKYVCAHCGVPSEYAHRECPTCGSLMVKEIVDVRGE